MRERKRKTTEKKRTKLKLTAGKGGKRREVRPHQWMAPMAGDAEIWTGSFSPSHLNKF